ncbi:hypothetical protein FOA52_015776 [Chlamydomonas sp. UWO 241]|nr:hypothetical protein FOA52_015776 [Chlamydomonas sp. UWO 241]
MACCVLIVEPAGRTTAAAAATSSAVSESAADGGGSEHGFIVTYANAAAVHMLLGHSSLPRTETAADAGAAGAGAGAAATAARTGGGLCGSPLSTLLPHAPPGLLSMPAASTTGGLGRGAQAPRMAVYARVELQQQQQEPEQQQQQQRVQAEPGQGHGAAAEPASGSGMRACRADVLACDVCSPSGRTLGRALLFDRWHCASNGRSGRPLMRELTEAEVPGEATLQAAVKAVRAQADAVRSLKQARGLGNQHPDVINGVTQLAIAKAMASELAALAGAYARGDAGLLAPFVELCTQREQAQQAQQEQGSRD